MKQTSQRHSDLKEWQARIPQIPWRYLEGTIVSEDGTTIASIGGDLKLQELSAAGEYLCHCANVLPVLIERAEGLLNEIAGGADEVKNNVSWMAWNALSDACKEAKAEHLAGRFPEELVGDLQERITQLGTAANSLLEEIEKMSGHWLPETDVKVRFARAALGLDPMPPKSPELMAEELLADAVSLATDDRLAAANRLERLTKLLQERLSGHTKAS